MFERFFVDFKSVNCGDGHNLDHIFGNIELIIRPSANQSSELIISVLMIVKIHLL